MDRGHKIPGLPAAAGLIALGLTVTAALRLDRSILLPFDDSTADSQTWAPWPDVRIDPNHAAVAELTLLPGIGPGLAERIVADREANGPFHSVEELARVKWIGPSHVERVRPHVMVRQAREGS